MTDKLYTVVKTEKVKGGRVWAFNTKTGLKRYKTQIEAIANCMYFRQKESI